MSLFASSDADARPRAKAGRRRQLEIAAENKVAIEAIAADLLKALQRPPLPAERILAEAIGAATVRCRRLRESGRDDAAERRELARLLRDFPSPEPAPEIA